MEDPISFDIYGKIHPEKRSDAVDFLMSAGLYPNEIEVRKKKITRLTVIFTNNALVFVPKIDSTPPRASTSPPLRPRWIRIIVTNDATTRT